MLFLSDYPCPKGFYPYKADCFNPNQLTTDYDSAVVGLKMLTGFKNSIYLKKKACS
jgi:hypothetical protein